MSLQVRGGIVRTKLVMGKLEVPFSIVMKIMESCAPVSTSWNFFFHFSLKINIMLTNWFVQNNADKKGDVFTNVYLLSPFSSFIY